MMSGEVSAFHRRLFPSFCLYSFSAASLAVRAAARAAGQRWVTTHLAARSDRSPKPVNL